MAESNGQNRNQKSKGERAEVQFERVCAICSSPLPLPPGAGGQELCPCARCNALVKPSYLSAENKAEKTRDTLRVLVLQETVPDQLAADLVREVDNNFWTCLRGANNRLFNSFDEFCRDFNGLRADPAVVRALLVKLRGRNAAKLMTTPLKRQGHRRDLDPTCGPRDEKSTTSPTNTRCWRIQAGPPEILRAFRNGQLFEKDAARLASYARDNPKCPKLQSTLVDLKAIPPGEKPKELLAGLRARIRGLPLARGGKSKAQPAKPSASTAIALEPTSSALTVMNSNPSGSQAAREQEPVGGHDHVDGRTQPDLAGPAKETSGSTAEVEGALQRVLDGVRTLDRLGFRQVDDAALIGILREGRTATRSPDARTLMSELQMLQEAAQLVSALDPTFAHYGDLRKIARRETPAVPAIMQGARAEVMRRTNARPLVKKARPPSEAKKLDVA